MKIFLLKYYFPGRAGELRAGAGGDAGPHHGVRQWRQQGAAGGAGGPPGQQQHVLLRSEISASSHSRLSDS